MSVKQHIPNAVTLLNLLCGCIAVIYVVYNNFVVAAFFVGLGILFDFFDGALARWLDVKSMLGLQLDSLADVVTSGVVPGLFMFKLIELSVGNRVDFSHHDILVASSHLTLHTILPFFGLFISLASAYRLAKFNLDTQQQYYFKGLPTPANTLLIISFALILEFQGNEVINDIIGAPWFLIGTTIVSCFLLNAPIKLFALKFNAFSFKLNSFRYIFLILSTAAIIVLKFAAVPLIILMYITMSLLNNKLNNYDNNPKT